MTKKIRLSLFSLLMVLISCTTAFAETDTAKIQKHTFSFTVPAETETASPNIWGQVGPGVGPASHIDTPLFYLEDRYFAYEMSACDQNGNAVQKQYSVEFNTSLGSTIGSMTGAANGGIYKQDWITINSPGSYKFTLYNQSDTSLIITVTYYSWK